MSKRQGIKKILLVGASSLLGKAILDLCPEKYRVIGTINSTKKQTIAKKSILLEKLDITNKRAVQALFLKHKFQIIIHAASIGNIDVCEKNKKKAYAVNVVSTSNIAAEALKQNAKMIFISSSAVFNGKNPPYSETSNVCPVNYYGRTKVKAEKIVLKTNSENIVLRLPLMYGWNNPNQRKNIITWTLDRLISKKQIMLSSDRYTSPVFNEDVARIIFKIIETDHSGIFHIGGFEIINRLEMGKMVAEIFNLDDSYIKNIKNIEYNSIADRACNEYFDITKMINTLKVKPLKIRKALEKMKEKNNYGNFSLATLKQSWKKTQKNNRQQEAIRRKVGVFNIYYNPERAKHLTDQIIQREEFVYYPEHDPLQDVFCDHDVLKKQKIGEFRLEHYSWDILSNTSPINEFHSLIIPNGLESNQHLTPEFIEDMFCLSSRYRDLSIAVNSWGAGASQNHFHSHLLFFQLPITSCPTIKIRQEKNVNISQPEKYPIVVLIFSLESPPDRNIYETFNRYIQELMKNEIPYNVLFHNRKIYLVPRKQERDEYDVKKGVDAVFGTIPVTSLDFLEKYELDNALRTLRTIGFNSIEINEIKYNKDLL